jgi:kinesin family protein 6/9
MMTSVLRDSLGGNCMTTMIATCSVDKRNIEVRKFSFSFIDRFLNLRKQYQLVDFHNVLH